MFDMKQQKILGPTANVWLVHHKRMVSGDILVRLGEKKGEIFFWRLKA